MSQPLRSLAGLLFITLLLQIVLVGAPPAASEQNAIAVPQLKWQNGGCYSSWCETGWYSSPAVADLDGDNKPEVIGSPYSLFVLNGEDGTTQWSVDPPGGRTWPGIVTADIDNDGDLEIVTAHGSGYLHVYDHTGTPVWSRQPAGNELRGLAVYDLDGDDTLEILVTGALGSKTNSWVYEHTGDLRPGWPQMVGDFGYGWGVFNDNGAIGDIDGDGSAEIVVPSDVHYINAYEAGGQSIPANAMYGGKYWGQVGVWESPEIELRGWGQCNGVRAESYRANFAHGPAVIADVDGNGSQEVIVSGNMYQCGPGSYASRYTSLHIFNGDRSRFNSSGYDWRTLPVDTGAPISEDYNVIESAQPNPVPADLDGDGRKEILFASYDGRLHAFWLDKTEHHSWPYNVNNTGPGLRFASEPAVADLDGDGKAEVIFTSWPQKGSGYVGQLHILNYKGEVVHEISLPAPYGSPNWNGSLPAPTLDNIDGDADLELVLNTAHSGLVAYDLPGTAGARVLWGTGRGNYQRSGSLLKGSLLGSTVNGSPVTPAAGEMVRITIRLQNGGPVLDGVSLSAAVPTGLNYAGGLTATSGTSGYTAGTVTWSGAVSPTAAVSISYDLQVGAGVTAPTALLNQVEIDDGAGEQMSLSALVIANGREGYLPVARNN